MIPSVSTPLCTLCLPGSSWGPTVTKLFPKFPHFIRKSLSLQENEGAHNVSRIRCLKRPIQDSRQTSLPPWNWSPTGKPLNVVHLEHYSTQTGAHYSSYKQWAPLWAGHCTQQRSMCTTCPALRSSSTAVLLSPHHIIVYVRKIVLESYIMQTYSNLTYSFSWLRLFSNSLFTWIYMKTQKKDQLISMFSSCLTKKLHLL